MKELEVLALIVLWDIVRMPLQAFVNKFILRKKC